MSRQVILCILDGWGYREDDRDNAVALARTPHFDRLLSACPSAFLNACGEDVGLPAGQIGNSEVGHTNIGAGRVVYQDLPRIDRAIANGEMAASPALYDFIKSMKQSGGAAHVMGLVSPGGVHAHQNHEVALIRELSRADIPVFVHVFLDGRDVAPQSAHDQVKQFLNDIAPFQNVTVATLMGRYYAMDRDKRWERVQLAYDAIVSAKAEKAADSLTAIQQSYGQSVTDEFVLPVILNNYTGMKDGDGILFTNFRADRARQLLDALLDPVFSGFTRGRVVKFAAALGMVAYSDHLNQFMTALFPPQELHDTLGEIVARAGLRQIRTAETEKYPHVTYFLNGGKETVFVGEERIMVASPKVATYDLQPEMSAREVTDRLLDALNKDHYDLVVINYANPDMVGHTGSLPAAIKAVETVDECLGRIADHAAKYNAALLVTADHGNCEMMRDPSTNEPHTAHTLNLVPVLLFNAPPETRLRNGRLADIAPTLLSLLGLDKPASMTGGNLMISGS